MPDRPGRAEAPPAPRLRADFEALLEAFDAACSHAGVAERDVEIAGFRVRLRAAGPALINELWPALTHLAVAAGGTPDLTVALWDSVSTGVNEPQIGWIRGPGAAPNEVRVGTGAGVRFEYRADEGDLVALDERSDLGVMWFPDHDAITIDVRAAPLRSVLHRWAPTRGVHLVHAGAVGGALLVGRGGSGKSTTAVACMLAGMSYVADDYALLRANAEPHVDSLSCVAKLDPVQAARMPALAPVIRPRRPGEEKVLPNLGALHPDRVVAGFPIRAVLVPRVGGGSRSSLRRVPAAEAFRALAPSTILGLSTPDRAAFPAMVEVVRRVPCYALELGSDLEAVPLAVREVLEAS